MARRDKILQGLEVVYDVLQDRINDFVLVGGAAAALLITDPAAEDVRPTDDIDFVVEIQTYAKYNALSEELRDRFGFAHDLDGPLCRFLIKGIKVDFLPDDGTVLNFTNLWYKHAMAESFDYVLPSGRSVRVVPAPIFICTKLEAYGDRGKGDLRASKDLEDIVSVLNGRSEVFEECTSASEEIRKYISSEFKKLIEAGFSDEIEGLLPYAEQFRAPEIRSTILKLIALS